MSKQFLKDALGWGILLWLIGYVLGIIFFQIARSQAVLMIVPPSMIGWAIMPIGIIITLWVLFKKVRSNSFQYYLLLAVSWTAVAIVFDYFFLVKVFKPTDGYYKLDVYLYYVLTFVLPLIVGWRKSAQSSK